MPKIPTRREVAESYDAMADDFDATRRKPWPETKDFIDSLPKNSLILDVGCGNGRNAAHALRTGHRVVGIDISKRMLAIARAKCPDRDFILADAVQLPFKDDTFGGAMCVAVLPHIASPAERGLALNEMWRILRVRGAALLGVWAVEQERLAGKCDGENNLWMEWALKDGAKAKRFYHLFTEAEFKSLVASSGMTLSRYFFRCDNHYALLGKA
ncbi:MAG: class I SAM-dependent methyltransferase [Euryarchaeota archaeon]|nr:class I SAM-dependent methyltransferase [Euryarchaeota archaeon]